MPQLKILKSLVKLSRNYIIYTDLNEYTPDSSDRYMYYGNKFKMWELNETARYCFWRALRKAPNDYFALTELADTEGRMGMFEFAVNHVEKALERFKLTTGIQQSDVDLLSYYRGKLRIKENIGSKLVDIINLSLFEGDPWELSKKWYKAGMSLDEINPKDIIPPDKLSNQLIKEVREEIKNAKILCLCQALLSAKKARKKNNWAAKEIKRMTNVSIRDIMAKCHEKFQEYFREAGEGKGNPLEGKMKSPVTEVLHHICFRAISTQKFKHKQKTRGFKNKKEEKEHVKKLSGDWGWIGGSRIRRVNREEKNVIKISPKVAVKCFELSLFFNKRNKASSNGYAWALFDAQKYSEAIAAFENDLKINPENPSSLTGIGIAYMRCQKITLALEYLKMGAEMLFKRRYEENPEKVIGWLRKTVENLKDLASISGDLEKEILKKALKVHEMIIEAIKEEGGIEISPKQLWEEGLYEDHLNLFILEAWSLKRHILTHLHDIGSHS